MPTAQAQDILLGLTGAPNGLGPDGAREEALSREFNPPAYLATHKPLKAICFQGFREQEKFIDGAIAQIVRLRAKG